MTRGRCCSTGGTGRELLKRGVPILTGIWSATALYLAPDIVRQVHDDFIVAGADIITTNTYGIGRERMAREGIEERYAELNQIAGRIAAEARDAAKRPIAVAGSLPPFSGSYRPDKVGSFETLVPLYREQASILEPYVDLYICETMSSAAEGLAAATAAVAFGKPVWVAWTLHEDRSGACAVARPSPRRWPRSPICRWPASSPIAARRRASRPPCRPSSRPARASASAAMPTPSCRSRPTGAPTARASTTSPTGRPMPPPPCRCATTFLPDVFAGHAKAWHSGGANVIGGCCGAGPEHIAAMRSFLDAGGSPNW